MATVTIAKSYFQALLRRAELHTAGVEFDTSPSLSANVTISKSEHDFLTQALRDLNQLKTVLFRGGLTVDTLNTLLASECDASDEPSATQANAWEDTFAQSQALSTTPDNSTSNARSPYYAQTCSAPSHEPAGSSFRTNTISFGQSTSSFDTSKKEDTNHVLQRVPMHDQRTILISNLADCTTHKDITSIIRGGRLLAIFLRHDRTATVSFVEGAAEFLAYTKRNNIHLHSKRLEFCWNDRQFHVPPHVSFKIAGGATRNLVIRGAYGKLTADQIREHLDHIHNLVVINIYFKNGNAYIFTNSIRNALFAKTCCMSRSAYKGLRIDWHPDECAVPLPSKALKSDNFLSTVAMKSMSTANRYSLLETVSDDDSDSDSDSEDDSFITDNIHPTQQWADAAEA